MTRHFRVLVNPTSGGGSAPATVAAVEALVVEGGALAGQDAVAVRGGGLGRVDVRDGQVVEGPCGGVGEVRGGGQDDQLRAGTRSSTIT